MFVKLNHDLILRKPGLVTATNLSLGLLIIVAVLFLVRDIVSIALPPREKITGSEKKVQPISRSFLQDYAAILKNNPFGFAAGELQPLTAAPGSSISSSDLSLIGTIAGPKRHSYAFFVDKTGKQEVFRIGDKVFGLGTLDRVEKDRVYLKSDGRQTEVPLADIAVVREVKPQGAQGSITSLGRRTGETSFVLDQQRIQQALEKSDQLMTDARFIPNIVEGKQQGFLLREVKPAGVYASLGLQNGDVLLKINDFTISNPETALQAVTALRGLDRAQLDVIRNGSRLTLTYQIR